MPQENRQNLYNLLSQQADIGTFEFFDAAMDDSNRRQKFYEQVSQHFNIGDAKTFNSKMEVAPIPEGFFGGGKPSGKGISVDYSTGAIPAVKSGIQESTLGLLLRERLPDDYEAQNFWERQLKNAATVVGDIPAMFVGGLVGTAGGGGLASAVTGTGAVFAFPAVLRQVLMDKYEKGEATSLGEVLNRTLAAVKEGAKGYITGAVTGTAGQVPIGIAKVPTEIAALTVTGAALDQRFPKAEEFLDNAVLLFGAKAASRGAKVLRNHFAKTGQRPNEVATQVKPENLGTANAFKDIAVPVEKPDAVFIGYQERLGGEPPLALFNITKEGHPKINSTVSEGTLLTDGLKVPNYPKSEQELAKDKPVNIGSQPEHPAITTIAETGGTITREKTRWDTHFLRQFINSPEYIVRKHRRVPFVGSLIDLPEARAIAARNIEAKQKADHESHVLDSAVIEEVKDIVSSKEEQKQVRGAMEKLYELSKEPEKAQALIDRNPTYKAANRIIQMFESIKGEYIENRRQLYKILMNNKMHEAFEEAIKVEESDTKTIAEKYKVDVEELTGTVKEYNNILKWGLNEYITNIERGTYRVIDSEGKVRALGITRREAKRKAKEKMASGEIKGNVTISSDFRKTLDPTKEREDILAGEENIVDALPTYSYIMRKKMNLDIAEAEMEKAFEKDAGQILVPQHVRNLLREQLKDARGRYSWGDMFIDKISRAIGTKPMFFSRASRVATIMEGYAKFSYRSVAGLVNFLSGHGNTWAVSGLKRMRVGIEWMKSEEGKRLLKEDEYALGTDFITNIEGRVTTKQKWYKPFGMFAMPEPGIRKVAYATAFTWARERGLSETAARAEARMAVRVQSFIYSSAALPRLLRGPGGRLVGQYRTYMVKQLELMSTLNGKQWARYLSIQLALAGPRGVLLIIKSLPILGLIGAIDKLEEWLLNKNRIGASGLPGMIENLGTKLGIDISAPATFQFLPNNPEDSLGPAISDIIRIAKVTVVPALRDQEQRLNKEGRVDWLVNFPIIYRYWNTILQAEVTPDGWIRDRYELKKNDSGKITGIQIGAPKYRFGTEWEKRWLQVMSAAGMQPTAKTRVSNALRILARAERVDRDSRRKLLVSIVRGLDRGEEIERWKIDTMVMLGMAPNSLFDAYKMNKMTPQQRATLRSQLIDKAKAWKIFID